MADWTRRTVTTTVREYALPNPTNWTQVRRLLALIREELPESRRDYDNPVTIRATDEEIIFSYEVETRNASD